MLASLLYPYDDDAPKHIGRWLKELEDEGCIRRYVIGSDTYLECVNWLKHQKIDKPSASRLPQFREASAKAREPSSPDLVSSIKDQDLGPTISAESASPVADAPLVRTKPHSLNGHLQDFQIWYDVYPLHKARRAAERAYASALNRTTREAMLAGAARYSADPGRDPNKTKHPATWLNGDCWLDESKPSEPVDELKRSIERIEKLNEVH